MYKVLIVDDESFSRRNFSTIIDWENYNMEICGQAPNGEIGIELVKKHKPHLVISDIMMNNMDGLDMINYCKRIIPRSLFVIVTGYREFEYAKRALSMHVFEYIVKPVDVNDFKKCITAAMKELDTIHQISSAKKLMQDKRISLINAIFDKKITEERIRECFDDYLQTLDFNSLNDELFYELNDFFSALNKISGRILNNDITISNMKILGLDDYDAWKEALWMMIKKNIVKNDDDNKSMHHAIVEQIKQYINDNYQKNINTKNIVSAITNLDEYYISRCFKKDEGMTIAAYVTNIRIENAKKMLAESNLSIKEITQACGFDNYKHFFTIFKNYTSVSPNDYRTIYNNGYEDK